jgi:hypothetical protein
MFPYGTMHYDCDVVSFVAGLCTIASPAGVTVLTVPRFSRSRAQDLIVGKLLDTSDRPKRSPAGGLGCLIFTEAVSRSHQVLFPPGKPLVLPLVGVPGVTTRSAQLAKLLPCCHRDSCGVAVRSKPELGPAKLCLLSRSSLSNRSVPAGNPCPPDLERRLVYQHITAPVFVAFLDDASKGLTSAGKIQV